MDSLPARAAKGSQDPKEVKATARKLKKRELDRKAQRLARERTKNRIQELESMVELLKADAFNPELSSLMATLNKVKQQRDDLQILVRSIDQTIQRHIRERAATPLPCEEDQGSLDRMAPSRRVIDDETDAARAAMCHPGCAPAEGSTAHAHGSPHGSRSPRTIFDQPWTIFSGRASQSSALSQAGGIENAAGETPLPTNPGGGWIQHLPEEHMHTCLSSDDIIVPRPQWPCHCLETGSSNTWRTANVALGKSTMLSPSQLAIEDFTSEDTPVRVVLDGWDSVAKAGKMSMSWWKLRKIDELCFSTCGSIERLGILHMMHLLLTYHGDPGQGRGGRIPRWLWTRPSQTIPHSYAIDFFVWPGLRERFIFTQHRYCTNLFWQLFRSSIRLNLPFDLADCYNIDPDTGRYVLSPMFDHRLRDINTWRMTRDFFVQFPELSEDIPVVGSIPPSVGYTDEDNMALCKVRSRQPSSSGQEPTADSPSTPY
ncbi:hypothetical protein DV735_g305, partial [Chaetothyriales sp. CBS 134920]